MRPPTRMRQVYDGGPPGKFRFPMKPVTVLFTSVLAFLVAYRLLVYPWDGESAVPSRLDAAADSLNVYYNRNQPSAGRVERVVSDGMRVDVRLRLSVAQQQEFARLPERLKSASLDSVCPASDSPVWDLIGGGQSIRIRAVDANGADIRLATCVRHRL
jgi:hypothetical protein